MQFFGIFSIVFGIIIVTYPEFLAYLIGFFFLFLGVNILVASFMFRSGSPREKSSWKIGDYEILKNRK